MKDIIASGSLPFSYQIGSGRSSYQRDPIVKEYINHIEEGLYGACSKFVSKNNWHIRVCKTDIFNTGGWVERGWEITIIPSTKNPLSFEQTYQAALSFAVKLFDVVHRIPLVNISGSIYVLTDLDIENIRNDESYQT